MGGDKAVRAWNIWNKKVRSELWKQGVYEEVSSRTEERRREWERECDASS